MDVPGKKILWLASVLFIVIGAVMTLLALVAVLVSALFTSIAGGFAWPAGTAAGGVLVVASVVFFVSSVLQLVSGILGVKKSGDPSHTNFFIINGSVLCALMLLSLCLSFRITAVFGLVLGIMYIVGGVMNQNVRPSDKR